MYMKKYLALAAIAALMSVVSCTDDKKPEVKPEPISVSPKSVTFEGEGGTLKVAVKSQDATFTAKSDASWLTAEVSGKEIVLTAVANDSKDPRSTKVTVSDSKTSCEIEVKQNMGSAVAGYTPLASAKMEYAGTMLYMFNKPQTENYGGMGFLNVADSDGNRIEITLFTDLFTSPEEVVLSEGLYTAGQDKMTSYYAVPKTWVPGGYETTADGEERFSFGTFFNGIDESTIAMTEGTMEVKDGILKIDFKDAEGNEYKYAFEGEVELDLEGATYPSEKIGPADNIYSAVCTYDGENEFGAASMTLMLYSGTEANNTRSIFPFYMEMAEFSEDMDLSGMYSNPEDPDDTGKAGTLEIGSMIEFGDFRFPMGSSIIFNDGDVFAADGMSSLILTKQEDGTYSIFASMMPAEGEDFYLYMTTISIELVNSADYGDDEED